MSGYAMRTARHVYMIAFRAKIPILLIKTLYFYLI